ncbi:SusC/RagA family TonB-linked outer membrane protein [Botryobacter ruber]|uniref:SusC/RagA family TonB-linked outer membrane protein n=1 Tax=Botryobacter ruber TaxID=2171629 RepID=UPI00196A3C29|nr:TonB-dependent receptor [Botryobacter ruber]
MITSLLKSKWGVLFCASMLYHGNALSYDNTHKMDISSNAAYRNGGNSRPEEDIFKIKPAQNQTKKQVRGTISDETGPIPGAAVFLKSNPSVGTATDMDGKFVLEVPEGDVVLVVKSVGYEQMEIRTGGKTVLAPIVLTTSAKVLDEAVVVAFGVQKKESVVSSITTIRPTELKVPSSNLTTALAGRLAGVIAYQRSGEPGRDNAEFFIRGATTFGYKMDPLILIDNMEYTTTDLARLTPDDIESFSILKDASANALYGARGANGVILITTKQGKEGKPKINLRFENSLSTPTRQVELADPITYMELHNQAWTTRNPYEAPPYTQSKIDNTKSGINPVAFPAVDWQNELLRQQVMNQRFNFNMSGGGKIATYYVAGALNKDNGNLKVDNRNNFNNNIDLKNYNLRSNVQINVAKGTRLGVRLNGNFDDYTGPIDGGTGIYNKIMRTSPVLFRPYYDYNEESGGTSKHIMFGNSSDGKFLNPYADMVKGYKEESRSLMVAQIELDQDLAFITPGLKLNAMTNVNRKSNFDLVRSFVPFLYSAGSYDKVNNTYRLRLINEGPPNQGGGTDYLEYDEGNGSKNVDAVFHFQSALNYSRTINEKHSLGGTTVLLMNSRLTPNAKTLQASLPARNFGISGRFTYGYDNRYFAEFNFGYNGSERFNKAERFGFFPSAGVAWQISNEKFFEPLRYTVHNLKIRGNYGLVGNDAIGTADERFFYLSEVNMDNSSYGATFGTFGGYSRNGISVNRYANPLVTWETAANSTIGLEIGLWNKLDIIAEYFHEERSNILMTRSSIPQTLGLQSIPKANVGKARSRSYELQLNYNEAIGNDIVISMRGNFTFARNIFKHYEEPAYNEPWLYKVGHSTSQQWGYIAERLFVDDEEVRSSPTQAFGNQPTLGGDIKFKDINGDGVITSLDQVPIGFPTRPEIVYGFGPAISYKNFDINFFMQGSARSSFWIDPVATAPFVDPVGNSNVRLQNQLLQAYADNHWSEENRDLYALWPRLSANPMAGTNNAQRSTWFMRDGSFLRLKQVEAGYTFPKRITDKFKMTNLRIYGTATNLLTFSKFKLWDVEMAGNGLGYPVQRVLNLGLMVGF